jgi:hypothetical protein
MAVIKDKRAKRKDMYQDAWLTLGGFARRECKVLNLSASGAKLEVDGLHIPSDNLGLSLTKDVRKFTRCRLVWRDKNVIGVEFVG